MYVALPWPQISLQLNFVFVEETVEHLVFGSNLVLSLEMNDFWAFSVLLHAAYKPNQLGCLILLLRL